MEFTKDAQKIEDYIIKLRRDFHMHPELSFKETRTSQIVCDELGKMGVPYVKLDENCVVGILKGINPGKKIAIRADMDALPITEENDVPYKSQNQGVMHACGHDGHIAMLIGTARLLSDVKEELRGTVYFCFQSAEEICGGAKVILDYLDSVGGVNEVIAAHLWADIPSGNISIVKGERMAAADWFNIEVIGKGGHASRPDLCIDPIKPAAAILLNLSSIPTNRYKTTEPLVVHVGKFQAGTLGNIFPQKATLSGGVRSFSEEGRQKAFSLIKEIAENGAKMYGAEAKVTITPGVPVVCNDELAVSRATKVINDMNVFKLDDFEQICASDNFGFYLQKYKGFYAYIGVGNKEKGLVYPQHHPKFDIDEDVLKNGSAFFAQYAFNFLKEIYGN